MLTSLAGGRNNRLHKCMVRMARGIYIGMRTVERKGENLLTGAGRCDPKVYSPVVTAPE